jgi:hypothetical protein
LTWQSRLFFSEWHHDLHFNRILHEKPSILG